MMAVQVDASASNAPASNAPASYMRKLGVTFGIKEGKKYTFTQQLAGLGERNISWTMNDVHVRKAKKKNYKELTFEVVFASPNQLSPLEVDAICGTDYAVKNHNSGAGMWYAVVDGATGLNLEGKNKVHVTVKDKNLDFLYNTYYGSSASVWQNMVYLWRTKVSVTYPNKYEDLCIGFGGSNVLSNERTKADTDFWKGKVPFAKTTMYRRGKTNSRWLRVSSLK